MPCRLIALMRPPSRSIASGERPAAGSSSNSTEGDSINARVTRYSTGGPSSFTGTDAPSAGFHQILGIAVDSTGSAYVVDWEPGQAGVLDKFDPSGVATGTLPPIAQAHAVAGVHARRNF